MSWVTWLLLAAELALFMAIKNYRGEHKYAITIGFLAILLTAPILVPVIEENYMTKDYTAWFAQDEKLAMFVRDTVYVPVGDGTSSYQELLGVDFYSMNNGKLVKTTVTNSVYTVGSNTFVLDTHYDGTSTFIPSVDEVITFNTTTLSHTVVNAHYCTCDTMFSQMLLALAGVIMFLISITDSLVE